MKIRKMICAAMIMAMTVGMSACAVGGESAASVTGGEGFSAEITNGSDSADTIPDTTPRSEEKTAGDDRAEVRDKSAAEKFSEDAEIKEKKDVIIASDTLDTGETICAGDEASGIDSSQGNHTDIPEVGQLTAGEWNDNSNWGFFTNLINTGTINFPSYGLNPVYRTMITVKSESGLPVVNATVRILDSDGNILWSAITDKNGTAYLFEGEKQKGASVEVESGDKKQSFELTQTSADTQSQKKTENTELELTFVGEVKNCQNMEIMFILDTTGSMSDEMLFLQSEFSAITKEIGTENTKYSVNFYRDEGDDYVTKCFDFTDDIDALQKNLNSESADGGGDIPEAVAEILKETISESSWSDESVKLAFLIFDAPPHDGKEKVLYDTIRTAAEKGIRIIPVVSSNSERDTELFGRSLAIMTGGTYIFLTDDSGIGDAHLEPIIGDYKVEKLYDIIIRVINEYRQ